MNNTSENLHESLFLKLKKHTDNVCLCAKSEIYNFTYTYFIMYMTALKDRAWGIKRTKLGTKNQAYSDNQELKIC